MELEEATGVSIQLFCSAFTNPTLSSRFTKMDDKGTIQMQTNSSMEELIGRQSFYQTFAQCPIPPNEILANLGLFVNRQSFSRMLFMHEIYKQIIPVHGTVVEFGVRWGQNLSLFTSFRGIYEPYNYSRKIIGFDTFSGFPSVSPQDGTDEVVGIGAYGVTPDYEKYLESILDYHEKESPLSHLRKYELVKGDACVTLKKYLDDHPETIISLAYFDFDIYEPTRTCLELIRPYLTKGSIVCFDELNHGAFPGETLAVKEVFGLNSYAICRFPFDPCPSYIVID
jgi:Cephalosporin hydroxylase